MLFVTVIRKRLTTKKKLFVSLKNAWYAIELFCLDFIVEDFTYIPVSHLLNIFQLLDPHF